MVVTNNNLIQDTNIKYIYSTFNYIYVLHDDDSTSSRAVRCRGWKLNTWSNILDVFQDKRDFE